MLLRDLAMWMHLTVRPSFSSCGNISVKMCVYGKKFDYVHQTIWRRMWTGHETRQLYWLKWLSPLCQQALDGTGTLQSSQSSVTENRTEENKGAEDVGDTSKDMAFLENQTKQLTLDSPDKDNQKKAVNNPVSIPNGIVRKTGHGSPFQSRKPPRFQTHRPPNLSRPSHLLSPTCQPNFHYTYPPPSHQYPMGPGITYTNTLPPTLQPQHYALNPISNISTAAFTSPPISPNIVSL